MNDKLSVKGQLTITLTKENGEKEVQKVENLVVATGLAYLASRATDASDGPTSHMAVGTGTTSPLTGNTTLETELARVALSSISSTDNIITHEATFPAGTGTGTLTEAGLLNAASGGILVARTTFAGVAKGASDALTIQWQIIIG